MSDAVRQFTAAGHAAFASYLQSLVSSPELAPPWHLLTDAMSSEAVGFTVTVEQEPHGRPFADRFEFGTYLVERLSTADRTTISFNHGLWNWLALYYFDQLCPPDVDGVRKVGAEARYLLPDEYRHTRYYRHLVRSPWLAVLMHPVRGRVILTPVSDRHHPLSTPGEVFEQVASRQGVFRSRAVMAAIDALWFDQASGRPRPKVAGSGGGSPRRLGRILKQFERTYDLEADVDGLVVGLLPREFGRWKKLAAKGGG